VGEAQVGGVLPSRWTYYGYLRLTPKGTLDDKEISDVAAYVFKEVEGQER
jgi:hypothetical protein